MIKAFSPQDNEALLAQVGQTVRFVETSAQIKQASSNKVTREILDMYKPDKDHYLAHVIAMGDEEHYGQNRNADAWTGDWLAKKAGTFVTHGHMYREHRNKHKHERIGSIKYAAYDPEMGRVELVLHGALKPREGEPLTAVPEYERARAGKNVDVSMSCRIPYDVCNCCGNQAKTASEYCSHFKKYRGQWNPEFQKVAYVLNPDPLFFDISSVENRADRTARFLEYRFADGVSHTSKAASTNLLPGGADLAAAYDITYSGPMLSPSLLTRVSQLKAAALDVARYPVLLKLAKEIANPGQLTDAEIEVFRRARPQALMRKLAASQVVLPFHSFVCVFGGATLKEAADNPVFKRAFDHLDQAMELAEEMGSPEIEASFAIADKGAENVGCDDVDQLMEGVTDRLGMRAGAPDECPDCKYPNNGHVDPSRPKLASLALILPASGEYEARAWAAAYGVYKASCIRDMETLHGTLPARLTPLVAVL